MLTVVTGPPCSGKSTYVTNHARPGDVVIDYDVLAQALGAPSRYERDEHVRRVTGAARRAAIQAAVEEHHRGATVWVVDSRPTAYRLRTYQQAGATLVPLDAPRDELHRRADAERPPLWHQLIDEWDAGPRPPRARQTTTERGLGHGHQRLREQLLPGAYGKPCPKCGEPMLPGQELDLGHAQDRAVYGAHNQGARQMEHARCNRQSGQALGSALRRARRSSSRKATVNSRVW